MLSLSPFSRMLRLAAFPFALLLAGCVMPGDPAETASVTVAGLALGCVAASWDVTCLVDAGPNDSPSQTEIDVAIDPTDPARWFVASKDMDPLASDDCVWSVGQLTEDAGKTWTTVYVGGTMEERADPAHPLYGWACVTDPILAYDADGILYYPLQIYNEDSAETNTCLSAALPVAPMPGCRSAYFLAVSRDGGRTFAQDDIISMSGATGVALYHDYPRMIVNPATDTVTTVWNAFSGGIYVASTRDQGRTIESALIPGSYFDTGLTVTSDGTVYLMSGFGLFASVDDARTFLPRPGLIDRVPHDCTPEDDAEYRCGKGGIELAADASGGERDGRLYAVWPDGRDDPSDILIAWSDDGGLTWSAPVKINDDATDHVQWMPRVDVGPDGVVHVVYLDRAYDPDDKLYDATYAWSSDGGETWSHLRMSETSSDGDLGIHQDGGPFIGDYIGIDVAGGRVVAAFPTTPNGRAEVFAASVVHE